jgi:hypothetical protein
MKYTLSIGVSEELLRTRDSSFEKVFEEKVAKLSLLTRRCNINHNVVEVLWRFEGTLTDPDYVLSRTDLLVGLVGGDERRISRFSIETQDCNLGGESERFRPNYTVLGETISVMSFKYGTGMYLHQRHWTPTYPFKEITKGFQKMCEWFTVQTSAYKAMEQGYTALTKHHRFADAAANFLEAQELILRNLEFPPITS